MTDADDFVDAETIDLSDEAVVSKSRDRQKREREEGDWFWRNVLGNRVGRREMWNLLQTCNALDTRFGVTGTGSPEPYLTWFLAGQNQVGQQLLLSFMRIDIENVHLMLVENDSRFAPPKRSKTPTE